MAKSKAPSRRLYQPGDLFAVPLPSDWWGAVRILLRDDERKPGDKYLVATTPYLGKEPPKIDDPRLKQTLLRHDFGNAGRPALAWLGAGPPDSLQYLGNLPLVDEAPPTLGIAHGWDWKSWSSDEAYSQWRWDNDRDAFVAEVNQKHQALLEKLKHERHKQRPKKMLADDDFWGLIALLDGPAQSAEDTDKAINRLISRLAKRTRTDIKRFEETLAYKLFLLDTEAHAEASRNSDDGFLYARCSVVASGPEYHASVVADPSKMPRDVDFEDLLTIARLAYERKTGEDLDYMTGCSYETGSNPNGWPPKGEGASRPD